MNLKKTALATGIALSLGATGAQAITPLGAGNYTMYITGGCFAFDNCQTTGSGTISDNTNAAQASISGFGSGIVGDGYMGVIDFALNGSGTITSVTSFSQDSYLATAGGTFYLRATDLSSMGGSIDSSGNMTFDTTGRLGIAAAYASTLGEQPWNIDDSTAKTTPTPSGVYVPWTTGTSITGAKGFTPGYTETGSLLIDAGAGAWTGTLVGGNNIGSAWGSFDNQQYGEVFNVKIVAESTVVPVPAAVWLFGSGLLGLVGIGRRKKSA